MTEKDKDLTLDSQFEDYLKRLEERAKEDEKKEKEAEKDKKDKKEDKEDSSSEAEGKEKDKKKLSDEEKDSISKKVDKDKKEEGESTEEKPEGEVVEDEQLKKPDSKHIRHSPLEEHSELEDAIERERSKRMRQTPDEEEEKEEEEEPELSEDEQEIAEMQAKKEQERLEREERQARFKEANEKYQKYLERNKTYYDAAQRDREARELAEAEELEARKSEELYTSIEKEKEKDTFADDFTKSVNAKEKDVKEKPRQGSHMQVNGVYEDDLETLTEGHSLKKTDKDKKKEASKKFIKKVDKKQVKPPKFTPPLGADRPKLAESKELQTAGKIFADLQQESIKDTFADSFTKAVNSKDNTAKPKAKQGDHMKVNGVYDGDYDTLTKGRKVGSDKDTKKDAKGKADPNKKVENLLKDKDTVKSVATDVAKDTAGEVQSAAKPSMGQESSESDEEKKKANAKKVGMKYLKLAEKELGKQVTIDGLTAELVKPNTAAGKAFKASSTGKALDAIKGMPLSQLVGHAMEIDDKKTSEENLRNALQKGFSIATQGDNFHKVLSSADKMLNEINQPKLGSNKKLLKGEGVDKSYKLQRGQLQSRDTIRLKGGEGKVTDGTNTLTRTSRFKVKSAIGGTSQAQVGLSSASANEVSGIGPGSRKLLLNKKDALARANAYRGDVGSLRLGPNAVGKNGLPLDNRALTRELINADKVSGANGRIRLNSQALREGNGLSQVSGKNVLGRVGEKTTLAGRSVVVGKMKVNGALIGGGTSLGGSTASALGASAMGSAGTISAATIERAIQGLKQNASMAGEFLGKMMKSTSHNENDEEMNPSNMAQKGRKMLNELNKKQTTHSTDSLKAKGITSSDYTTKEALLDEQQKAAHKASETFGKKHTEHQIVNKGDGSLRMVREGHDAGVKEIRPDAPGLARREADKKLLEGRKLDPKMKGTESLDKAKEALQGNKDGAIRLGRGGKFDVIDKEAQNLGKTIDKMGSKQASSLDKLNIVGKNGGKMGNLKVGRGAKIGAKSGPLSQQAESMKQSWQMMRQYWARNSFANQLIGGGQGNVLGKALAKKAVVSVVSTGVSAGAASGGSSMFGGGSKVRQDSFAVIAADTYDDANDKTPMTQDAVNMMEARIAAYIKQALGKKLTADDQLKAGGKYVPVPDIGIKHVYNGKPVTQFDYKMKFVDRNMQLISRKYFALDQFSDLALPGDTASGGSSGGGAGGAGGDGRPLSPSDTGHPLDVPYMITQGLHHQAALDLGAPEGSPIFAVADGEVVDVNTVDPEGFGNYVMHTLPNGEYILYAHMRDVPLVKIGDKVKKGDHIGYVGSTGRSTGPHIHFDIRSGNGWKPGSDPWKLLPGVPSGSEGIWVDPRTSKAPEFSSSSGSSGSSSSSSSSTSDKKDNKTDDSSGAKKNANGETQMDIMFNIVGALETGGQVYGQRDYSNFINVEAGAEVTATLGWSSFYGVHGKEYLQRFKAENPDLFSKLDTAGVNPVLDISWEDTHWQANPAQKAAIVEMISTPEGRKLQDTMTAERLSAHWKYAVENYTDNMRAVAWYTNIAELAGSGTAQTVFDEAHGDYSLENLYNVTMSHNGCAACIGASLYHSRHALYKQWIEEHYGADEKVDLANIKTTGAGSITTKKSNSRNSANDRKGQILLIKVILSMSAIGSHYGEPISEEDYFKYCIEVLDHAFKGKKGDGIKITYRDNGLTASAFTEFRVLTELHELEEMDTKFKAWDLFDDTYGDMNPQAYIALPNKDFEEIFNIKININGSGLNGGGGGGGGASGIPYIKWALEIAADPSHGYDQGSRNGDPDYDCSSFIFYALKQAGFDVGETPFTTFDMKAVLERNGFTAMPYDPSTLEPGDILLDESEHCEIYIGNGQTVGAHLNERGDIRGGEPGDQNGQEISVMPIWRSWPLVMRPPKSYMDQQATALGDKGDLQFDENGLLKMKQSDRAQEVINLLSAIPGHRNGASYHQLWNIDSKIDELTTEEAVWIMYRIEDPGFGQTGAGLAGVATPEAHKAFVEQQVNNRFGGSIHELLKHWGTYNYDGY